MRRPVVIFLFVCAVPALAQPPAVGYKIDFDPSRDVKLLDQSSSGKAGLYVKVHFGITIDNSVPAEPASQFKIIIEENGHKVHEADVPAPTPTEDLAVVLAMDTSGSMKEHGRMDRARNAADYFLTKLPSRADLGLILFDHEIRTELPLSLDRGAVKRAIAEVQPRGGTAFLDAAMRGVDLLKTATPQKHRYLILLTDGVDLNSEVLLTDVIAEARANNVRILTVGIGEPGRQERVNTILVLDQSGSMRDPANDQDPTPKIAALHRAATRFVSIMPTTGWASIISFSSTVDPATEFSNDRTRLVKEIQQLRPLTGTALFDATFKAIETLDAEDKPGKRAIIVMTDGVDNRSNRRAGEVVERARDAKIPIYTLGFGRDGELDKQLLDALAEATGGRFFHARDEKSLVEIFENLSIRLHDDGIDEIALKQLAQQTGGQYFPVKDISQLKVILERVTETIQRTPYEIEFPSRIQKRDGTNRLVTIKLVRRSGELASNTAGGMVAFGDQVLESAGSAYQTRGLVVAEMHPLVYLFLLMGLVGMLAAPALLRRRGDTTSRP